MKRWLSGCDEAMRIRMDGGTVGVQIEQQCRLAMLLVTMPGCGSMFMHANDLKGVLHMPPLMMLKMMMLGTAY